MTGFDADPSRSSSGDDATETERLCQALVDSGKLHLITQISAGIPDFVIDSFDRVAPEVEGMADGVARFRSVCTGAARLITTFADTQEDRLDDARTGRLIRVVLHADGGTAYCYSVVDGQYVVGFVFVPPAERPEPGTVSLDQQRYVNEADHEMTTLIDELRGLLGLPAQNAGGWSSAESWAPSEGADPDEILTAAVDAADLQYVTRLRTGCPAVTADAFDASTLARHFSLVSSQARRKLYDELSADMLNTVGQVNRLMRTTVGGTVQRVVLDVEQGAVIYYRLGVGDYIVGVTVTQDKVGATDGKLGSLAKALSSVATTPPA